jgi:ABC-type uncharacterized transport system ATPase subunit
MNRKRNETQMHPSNRRTTHKLTAKKSIAEAVTVLRKTTWYQDLSMKVSAASEA